MDASVSGGEHLSHTRFRSRFLASLAPRFGVLWQWLAGLVRLTEQEEEDAGIYLGD